MDHLRDRGMTPEQLGKLSTALTTPLYHFIDAHEDRFCAQPPKRARPTTAVVLHFRDPKAATKVNQMAKAVGLGGCMDGSGTLRCLTGFQACPENVRAFIHILRTVFGEPKL